MNICALLYKLATRRVGGGQEQLLVCGMGRYCCRGPKAGEQACVGAERKGGGGLQNATEMLEALERAFDSVKSQLFQRLHDKLREELFPAVPPAPDANGAPYALLPAGKREGDASSPGVAGNGALSPASSSEEGLAGPGLS